MRFPVPLLPHPATPCPALDAIGVDVAWRDDGGLALSYSLRGDLGRVAWPTAAPPARVDGLWAHTCCEAFLGLPGEAAYREFNFAPSGQWAAYAFSATRQRAADPELDPLPIAVHREVGVLTLAVVLPASVLPVASPLELGLSVVVEARDGRLAYWALRHPSPAPDFHHREAFALTLNRQP